MSATTHRLDRTVGTLLALDGDVFTVAVRGPDGRPDTLDVSAANVTSLERSAGRSSRAGAGAAVGALLFGTLGIVAASMDSGCAPAATLCFDYGPEMEVAGILLGVAAGAGLGALIGMAIKHDRWEPWRPAPRTVQPIVGSDGRNITGGVRIALP